MLYDDPSRPPRGGAPRENLGAERDRSRRILDAISDLVFELDAEDHVTFTNRGGSERLGYTQEELHGAPISDIVHVQDWKQLTQELTELRSSRLPRCFKLRLKKREGQSCLYEILVTATLSNDGSTQIVGVGRMLDRVHDEPAIGAEPAVQAIDQLAHSLNNRLATIQMAAECALMERSGPDSFQAMERALRDVLRMTRRCATAIRDATTSSVPTVSRQWPATLNDLVITAVDRSRALLEDHKLVVELSLVEDLPKLGFDPAEVGPMLEQLIRDAVESSEPSIPICIRTEHTAGGVALTVVHTTDAPHAGIELMRQAPIS